MEYSAVDSKENVLNVVATSERDLKSGMGSVMDEVSNIAAVVDENSRGTSSSENTNAKSEVGEKLKVSNRHTPAKSIEADGAEEDEYVMTNSTDIYNWARFQTGPVKASEMKEVYPELHINIIDRCIAYLVQEGKFKLSEKSTKRCSLYEVIVSPEEKIVRIEDIKTSVDVSFEVIEEEQTTITMKEQINREPLRKKTRSSPKQSKEFPSSSSSSSTPSSPPSIFLHVENKLPTCTKASTEMVSMVMSSISSYLGTNDCASVDMIKALFDKQVEITNDAILCNEIFDEIIEHLQALNKIMVVDEAIYLI